jgi:hypothetical protein
MDYLITSCKAVVEDSEDDEDDIEDGEGDEQVVEAVSQLLDTTKNINDTSDSKTSPLTQNICYFARKIKFNDQ